MIVANSEKTSRSSPFIPRRLNVVTGVWYGEWRGASQADRIGYVLKLLSLSVAAASLWYALLSAGAASADPKGVWLAQDGAHVPAPVRDYCHP